MRFRLVASIVLLVIGACQRERPTSIGVKLSSGAVRFEAKPPDFQGELPAFELVDATPKGAFFSHIPQAQQDRLRNVKEDFEFHPNLAAAADEKPINLKEAPALVEKTLSKMRDAFAEPSDKSLVADEARVLHVARAERGEGTEEDHYHEEKPVLLYVSLRRRVNNLRVDGPGSRFTVAVSEDGNIQGAVFYWKAQQAHADKPLATIAGEKVTDAISKQLELTHPHGEVVVKKIELAYFDANKKFLQPVYRYVADLTPASSVSKGRTSLLVGYVPLTSDPELLKEVPTDLAHDAAAAKPPWHNMGPPRFTTTLPKGIDPEIAVGRYITHDEHTGWARDSEAFWQELTTAAPKLFNDTQNYPSRRFMLTSRKDYFVNAVDLALIEAHGSPLTVMSHRDFGEDTRFNADVPLSGYGMQGGGRLKHLIVHSCRVIPAPTDQYYQTDFKLWASYWWDLFNGLSSVVGYRSSMFIDDGAGAAMGRNLARGEAVVPAWFGAVTSLNIYEQDSFAMTHCASPDLLGRASAIAVCGEGTKATVRDGSSARPTCLEAWWLGDELIPVGPSTTPMHESPGACPDEGDEEGPYPPPSR
jgi:hypothetical protein